MSGSKLRQHVVDITTVISIIRLDDLVNYLAPQASYAAILQAYLARYRVTTNSS